MKPLGEASNNDARRVIYVCMRRKERSTGIFKRMQYVYSLQNSDMCSVRHSKKREDFSVLKHAHSEDKKSAYGTRRYAAMIVASAYPAKNPTVLEGISGHALHMHRMFCNFFAMDVKSA